MTEALASLLHRLDRERYPPLGRKILRYLLRPARGALLRRDPDRAVRGQVGDRPLWINWTHSLPGFLEIYPHYESEIGRLAAAVHRPGSPLILIDVGANVGDSIHLLPPLEGARFLCVEGSRRYYSLLVRNTAADPRVKCVWSIVADRDEGAAGARLEERHGSAHLQPGAADGATAPAQSLDRIVADAPEFAHPGMLKIDTDGFDFRVLRGAEKILREARPALHFELSFGLWESVGGTPPAEAFAWLAAAGYRTLLLYDNHGYLLGTDDSARPVHLDLVRRYASRRRDFYLNVVSLHQDSPLLAAFVAAEERRTYQ